MSKSAPVPAPVHASALESGPVAHSATPSRTLTLLYRSQCFTAHFGDEKDEWKCWMRCYMSMPFVPCAFPGCCGAKHFACCVWSPYLSLPLTLLCGIPLCAFIPFYCASLLCPAPCEEWAHPENPEYWCCCLHVTPNDDELAFLVHGPRWIC